MLTEREMSTKVCSKCKEVKVLSEFNKRKASKDGYQFNCRSCTKEKDARHRAANPDYQTKWYAANHDHCKKYSSNYRESNPEKCRSSIAKWHSSNTEKERDYRAANSEKIKERGAKWCAANLEKGRAKSSNRRAAKLKAIPKWLTEKDWQDMEAIGKEADRLTRETGVKYEVDHIHPLQGKLICGLQCPTNLQILTMTENRSKGNRFKPYVESA